MMAKAKIHPFLWFDSEAEDAMNLYCSVFRDSKPGAVSRYPDSMPGMGGKVMTVEFEIEGLHITALNAGPQFRFNEAISLYVDCEDQAEVDRYWNALIADGGEESMCGWLKDRFGLSWQIIPRRLTELMNSPDRDTANRTVQAMLQMRKIVVADLENAAAGD
jgi:predicted 3-demethylubiquinone-9 3-methyltransferase (glyoxalase superfamily)